MIGYFFALLPLYVLVYLPLSYLFYGSPARSDLAISTLNSSLIASNDPLSCPSHSYNTHLLSHEPLIIYIEKFLSTEESKHLLVIRYLKHNSEMSESRNIRPKNT